MLSAKAVAAALAVIVLSGGASYSGYRLGRHFLAGAPQPPPSAAVVYQAPPPAEEPPASPTPTPAPTPLPASVLIKVPYTPQSPFNQWGSGNVHEEYCEAAALLMVRDFFKGDSRAQIPKAEADGAMAQIVGDERRMFPGVLDLPLSSIGSVGTMYGLNPTVMPVDLDAIERNLASGRPVIIPVMTHGVNGQKISPHYGSLNVYHVIVLIGYDNTKGLLYANDAGFVEGQNYTYTWNTLSTAIDAQARKFAQGRVMLVFQAR
jgi:peptidase C39-like protein